MYNGNYLWFVFFFFNLVTMGANSIAQYSEEVSLLLKFLIKFQQLNFRPMGNMM